MMTSVRVRIAPSPTGFAHVGTAYTSLFNYAFAKKNQGQFILRIEDTDIKRHVPEAEKAIFAGLRWLGLNYDEGPDVGGQFGPYRQSERLALYKQYADQLLVQGSAYRDQGAIRLKVSKLGETGWNDLIRGKICFQNETVEEFVLLKSNGYPTYNFAVVVDDLEMKISHVIRAEDHISNTPRQLLLYQALDRKPPEFAHLPLLRNPDRSKISKRKNPVVLSWYQEQGYLPEALVNFFCLLGWSHPQEKDVFSLDEFTQLFTFDRISKTAPIFDFNKLDWINGVYIREKSEKALVQLIKPFAPKGMGDSLINQTIPLVKQRLRKLSDYPELVDFFLKEPKVEAKSLFEKGENKKLIKEQLEISLEDLATVKAWKAKSLEDLFRKLVKDNHWHLGKYFMMTRIAVTGKTATPPLFETMEVLGKEKTIRRLKAVLKKLS
jgi:glutamyl-tRNA synthetase